jgi:protein-S-isoprenylcysteine O-methyltransferase Ste14
VQERLAPELNVSYVETQARPPTQLVLRHYAASAVLYGLLLALLALNPWFKGLLSVSVNGVTALQLYWRLYELYLAAALPVLLLVRPPSLWVSKNLLVVGLVGRCAGSLWGRIQGSAATTVHMSYKEKHALAFLLIKVFFGPLMLNAAFIEVGWCETFVRRMHPPSLIAKLDFGYIVLVHLLFIVDATLFFVSYHTEAKLLKNEIRYTETNVWGILVCIMCYPPFNQATISLLGPSFNDPYILVMGNFRGVWTWTLRALAVLFLCLVAAASLSLFTRASNLTNRGIVSWGPYRFIRHPDYFARNMFWLMTIIPSLIPNPANVYFSWAGYWAHSAWAVCGLVGWGTIYFLRAVTEERLLSRDPGYAAYCQKVKFRFIPGLY